MSAYPTRRRPGALRTGLLAIVAAIGSSGCSTPGPTMAAPSREDIHVLRSIRDERIVQSTWCTPERTGLKVIPSTGFMLEDRYTMWSISTDARNGRIVDTKGRPAGDLHACFGATASADSRLIGFYTEGAIAGQPITGIGDCAVVRADVPEKGLTTLRCHLTISGLPAPYVGGFLTTNTLGSRLLLGDQTDPPGYAQASIATIRLWRTP